MAGGMNLTAMLNIQVNSGSLKSVQSQISSTLKGLNVDVGVNVSPTAASSLNTLNTNVQTLSTSLQKLRVDAANAAASLNSLSSSFSRFSGSAGTINVAVTGVAASAKQTAAALHAGGDQAEYFGHQMRLSAQRFISFTAAVGTMTTFTRYFREAITEAANFERQMAKINQISSESPAQVAAIGEEVGRVSVQWGVSSKELVKVAEQLKQTGLSVREVQAAIEPIAKASLAPSFGDMTKTTQGAIALMRQFGLEVKDLESSLGSINAVAKGFAVESNDIIEAAKRAGGSFKAAGGDMHEFIATFTAVRATTRESAETIATGMRTIFSRLQRSENVDNLRQLGIQLNYTRREAEQMGNINLEGKFVGPMEAVRRIGQALQGMSAQDPRFAAVAEQVGGYRQIAQVIPLIQQQRLAQDAYNTSLAGTTSLSTTAEKAQGALYVQTEKVRQELMTLGRNTLASPGFRAMIDMALKLASAFITVADVAKPLIPVLAGLAAIKLGQSFGSMLTGFVRGPMPNKYHTGGSVPGSGERMAVLEGGEYVVNRKAAQTIGHGTLEAINRYADGGYVARLDPQKLPGGHVGIVNFQKQAGLAARSNMIVPLSSLGGEASKRASGVTTTGAGENAVRSQARTEFQAAEDDPNRKGYFEGAAQPEASQRREYVLQKMKTASVPTGREAAFRVIFERDYEQEKRAGTLSPARLASTRERRSMYIQDEVKKYLGASGALPSRDRPDAVEIPIVRYTFRPAYRTTVTGIFKSNLTNALATTADQVIGSLPQAAQITRGQSIDDIYQKTITNQGSGRFFEGVLQAVADKTPASATQNFDFPGNNPPQLKALLGLPPNIFADAKLTDDYAARLSVAQKAIRQFGLAQITRGAGTQYATSKPVVRTMDDVLATSKKFDFLGNVSAYSSRLATVNRNPLDIAQQTALEGQAMSQADDATLQALGLSRRKSRIVGKFAEGGVVTAANIKEILEGISKNTGIDIKKLVRRVSVRDSDWKNKESGAYSSGFSNKSDDQRGSITLYRRNIKTVEQLRTAISHELGHSVDEFISRQEDPKGGSQSEVTKGFGKQYATLLFKHDFWQGKSYLGAKQRYGSSEGFANYFAEQVGPNTPYGERLTKQSSEFWSKVINRTAKATNSPPVLTSKNINRVIKQFSDSTGIDFRKLADRIQVRDDLDDKKGIVTGRFDVDKSGKRLISLSRKHIKTQDDLLNVLAHEFGHGADHFLAKKRVFSSEIPGTDAYQIGGREGRLNRADDAFHFRQPKDTKYRDAREEGFANAFRRHIVGSADESLEDAVIGRGFRRRIIDPLAKTTSESGEGTGLGLVGRLANRKYLGAPLRWLGFASGGVVTSENVQKILAELSASTGINFKKLVRRFKVEDHVNGEKGTYGEYEGGDSETGDRRGTIKLSKKAIKNVDDLRYIMAHELGHAVDHYVSGDDTFSSEKSKTLANVYGKRMGRLQLARDRQRGVRATDEEYSYGAVEGFANLFAEKVTGLDDPAHTGSNLQRASVSRGFERKVIEQVAKQTNPNYQEKDLGFFSNLARKPGVFGGVARFFGFAEGGHVNARVMPGEYIFMPGQAQKIGVQKLHRLNDYGQFATGGLVPGKGNTDSVPMSLPAGSFVIKKRSVEKIGAENLHQMAQHYASGGPVHFADGDEVRQHEVQYRAVKGELNPADLQRAGQAAQELGIALRDTTRVVVEYRTVMQETKHTDQLGYTTQKQVPVTQPAFVRLADQQAVAGVGPATQQELKDRYRLKKEEVLPAETRNILVQRNIEHLQNAFGAKYGKSLGDDTHSQINEMVAMAARTFDPTKGGFTAADVGALSPQRVEGEGPTKLDKNFINWTFQYGRGRLGKEVGKKRREVAMGGEDDQLSEVASRDKYDPSELAAANEMIQQHGSAEKALAAHQREEASALPAPGPKKSILAHMKERKARQAAQVVVSDEPGIDRSAVVEPATTTQRPAPAGMTSLEDAMRRPQLPASWRSEVGRGPERVVPPTPGDPNVIHADPVQLLGYNPAVRAAGLFPGQSPLTRPAFGPPSTLFTNPPTSGADRQDISRFRSKGIVTGDPRQDNFLVSGGNAPTIYVPPPTIPPVGIGEPVSRPKKESPLLLTGPEQRQQLLTGPDKDRPPVYKVTPIPPKKTEPPIDVEFGPATPRIQIEDRRSEQEAIRLSQERYATTTHAVQRPHLVNPDIESRNRFGQEQREGQWIDTNSRLMLADHSEEVKTRAASREGQRHYTEANRRIYEDETQRRLAGTAFVDEPFGTRQPPPRKDMKVANIPLLDEDQLRTARWEKANPEAASYQMGKLTDQAIENKAAEIASKDAEQKAKMKREEEVRRERHMYKDRSGDPLYRRQQLRDQGISLQAETADLVETRRMNQQSTYADRNPVEDATQRKILENEAFERSARQRGQDLKDAVREREAKRAEREARQDRTGDPLARRAALRAQGITLGAEMADVVETRKETRVPTFAETNPQEDKYQKGVLGDAEATKKARDLMDKRAERASRKDRSGDPLLMKQRRKDEEKRRKAAERVEDWERIDTAIDQGVDFENPFDLAVFDREGQAIEETRRVARRKQQEQRKAELQDRFGSQVKRRALFGPGGKYVRTTADELAQSRTDREIGLRGGQDVVHPGLKSTLLTAQKEKLDQELIAVTQRQIQALYKGVTATEARALAELENKVAQNTGAKVVRDSRGRTVGYDYNVEAMAAAGKGRADGRNRFTGWIADQVGDVGQGVSNFRRRVSGANESIMNRMGGQTGFNFALMGLSTAGSMLSSGIDHKAGTAQDAVTADREGSYGGWKGAGGAVMGTVTGMALGAAVGGPIGAAVGGVVGGVTGLVSALKEADKEIRDVKITNAMTQFSDKISQMANQLPSDWSEGTWTGALKALRTASQEGNVKSSKEATTFFGGFDAEAYTKFQQRELRQNFGGQLPQMQQFLQNQVDERIKRGGTNFNSGDMAKEIYGLNDLNKEMMNIIARIRGVPISQVLEDFAKQIQKTQRDARLQADVRTGQVAEGRSISAFSRLASAVEAASYGLDNLNIQSKMLAEVFQGQLAATPVKYSRDVLNDPRTGNQQEYREALGGVTAGLGEGGRQLYEAGDAANQVASILPTILTRVIASTPLKPNQDYNKDVRRELYSQLGFGDGQGAPEAIKKSVESVLGQLAKLKPEDIQKETQSDSTHLANRLSQGNTDPIREASVRIAKALEAEANRFIEGLTNAAKMAQEIGQGRDRLAGIQLAGTRQAVSFWQQDVGRRHEGVNDIPLEALQRPFQQRQERLVGFAGAAATDPEFITKRLAEVRGQLTEAQERQQNLAQASGGRGPGFEAAASDLVRLRDQASRLQEALRHLADASERNAAAQEKLQSIQRDRESRLSYGERFIRAGADERAEMQRGMLLANAANNMGSVKGFSNEDQRLIMDTLSSLGNTKLTAFKGQPVAADLKDNLVREFLGPRAEMDQDNRRAEAELKNVIIQNFQAAAEAQKGLVAHQQELHTQFFANLQQSHQKFLQDLQVGLAKERLNDRKSQYGQAGEDLRVLGLKKQQADVLKGAGVTTDKQVEALRTPEIQKLLGEYQAARDAVQKRQTGFANIANQSGAIADTASSSSSKVSILAQALRPVRGSNAELDKSLAERFTQQGIEVHNDEIQSIREEWKGRVKTRLKREAGFSDPDFNNMDRLGETNAPRYQQAQKIMQEELRQVVAQRGVQGFSKLDQKEAEVRRKVNDQVGSGFRVEGVENITALTNALQALQGTSIDGLNKQIDEATRKFNSLKESMEALDNSIRGMAGADTGGGGGGRGRFGFAEGGHVPYAPNGVPGKPQGTDTVPAWLTPGEFIVNAAAAAANRQLLEHINGSRGPVRRAKGGFAYLAGGGIIGAAEDVVAAFFGGETTSKPKTGGGVVGAAEAAVDALLGEETAFKQKTLASYDEAKPERKKALFRQFTQTMGTDNVYAISSRFSDEETWKNTPPKWRGYIQAYLSIYGREQAGEMTKARDAATAYQSRLFSLNDRAPRALTPADASRIEETSYQNMRQRFATQGIQQQFMEELLSLEKQQTVIAERADAKALSPEQKGEIRALREYQAFYIQNKAQTAGNLQVRDEAGKVVVASSDKIARGANFTPAQREIMADVAAVQYRASFAGMKTFDERKKYFETHKGWAEPQYVAERRRKPERFTPEQNAQWEVFMEQYKAFQQENAAWEAQQKQQAAARQQAQVQGQAQEAANKQFLGDQPIVEDELRRQAATNPGGAAAQIMLGRTIQAMQAQRRWILENRRGGMTIQQWRQLEVYEQKELERALAASYYNNQVSALAGRQRLAHFGGSPLAAFGLSLPGLQGQQDITGSVIGFQAQENRDVRNPDPWMKEHQRRGRQAAVGGPQRLPFNVNDVPPIFRAEGGIVPGTFTGGVDDVPARLTKGEYVLSRPAVQTIGVAALERFHMLAKGGTVQYLQGGGFAGGPPSTPLTTTTSTGGDGLVAAFAGFNAQANNLAGALNSFSQSSQTLAQAFNAFGGNANSLTQALANFPSKLTVESQGRVEVVINGIEILARLQDGLQAYIASTINDAIKNAFRERLPDA